MNCLCRLPLRKVNYGVALTSFVYTLTKETGCYQFSSRHVLKVWSLKSEVWNLKSEVDLFSIWLAIVFDSNTIWPESDCYTTWHTSHSYELDQSLKSRLFDFDSYTFYLIWIFMLLDPKLINILLDPKLMFGGLEFIFKESLLFGGPLRFFVPSTLTFFFVADTLTSS